MNIKDEDCAEDYARQCLNLPALIHQCGLCQALAFLESKGKNVLLDDLAISSSLAKDAQSLTDKVRKAEMQQYQWMSREMLSCALWFKRYAEAVLKVEHGGEKASTQ